MYENKIYEFKDLLQPFEQQHRQQLQIEELGLSFREALPQTKTNAQLPDGR